MDFLSITVYGILRLSRCFCLYFRILSRFYQMPEQNAKVINEFCFSFTQSLIVRKSLRFEGLKITIGSEETKSLKLLESWQNGAGKRFRLMM